MSLSRKLFLVVLAVAVGFQLSVSAAFADDRQVAEQPKVGVFGDTNGIEMTEVQVDNLAMIRFDVVGTQIPHTGTCEFYFEIFQNGGWVAVSTVHTPMNSDQASFVRLIGADCQSPYGPAQSISLGVGAYRVKTVYIGDENWLPAEADWYEFSIIPSSTPPAPPVNPPVAPPVSPPAPAADPAPLPAPVARTAPVEVAPEPVKVDKPAVVKTVGTVKKSVKVYSKANKKGKKLATLKKGKTVTIVGKSGKYYKVTFKLKGKTKTGFVVKTSIKVKK
jgi:hypothetical protein